MKHVIEYVKEKANGVNPVQIREEVAITQPFEFLHLNIKESNRF